jgi:predicted extracellular nuclease
MINRFFGLFLGFALLTSSLSAQKKEVCIAFYNVENLYDTINDPEVDDEEFLPQGKNKWTGERFEKKLNNLARVIDSLGGGPSVLGMCEVENKYVLEQLIDNPRLKGKGFGIVHHNSPDKRGIDVSLIYKKEDFTPSRSMGLRVKLPGDSAYPTRDILLVSGNLCGKPVFIFVNHWPSRRGGELESAPKRMAAARVARHAVDSIMKSNSGARVILLGDFNDQPSDPSLLEGLKAEGSAGSSDLINLSAALAERGEGSHSYKENWNMLDNLIVSRNMLKAGSGLLVVPESAGIYHPIWMQDKYARHQGAPYRTYAGPKFIGGYSDHYPVFFKLNCN